MRLKAKDIYFIEKTDEGFNVTLNKSSNTYKLYEVSWLDVPRYDSKGNKITPDQFKQDIISQEGLTHWNSNYANEFIGSTDTMISPDALKTFISEDPEEIWDGKLKIYRTPREKRKYIMAIDPAKGGLDAFAIQVLDVTEFPFEQVASAQIFNTTFQKLPIFIDEWARRFNYAFLIIENNEGAGTFINEIMFTEYEYENLFRDRDSKGKFKSSAGFRTTSKTRGQILGSLKMFLENFKLKLHDAATISELFSFIKINDKYQAQEGAHDDMVMSIALAFAPFTNSRNFEDYKGLVEDVFADLKESDNKGFSDYMVLGDFDDYTDDFNENFNENFEFS